MKEKAELRAAMIARREGLSVAERSRHSGNLVAALTALPEYAAARSVLATMAIGSEWDTKPFLERARRDGKTLVLPRVAGPAPKRLRLHAVADLDADLVPGVWDIPEPDPSRCPEVSLADVDFAWIPALAVSREGYRLGYGAGYFDKLLAGRGPRPYCVVALPAAFVSEELPHEPHDVPVDLVITPE
jgi:5,10-methenyltetrahydrofolate synthetase